MGGFRKLNSVKISKDKQGFIRYTCLCWREQPKEVQEKIKRLCREVGREKRAALWRKMTTRDSAVKIALEFNLSESTLYAMQREFYRRW